jgi:hypothetical protein
VERVDNSLLEVPCRYLFLEEDVQLAVGATIWFRKPEVRPDGTAEAETGPKEAGLPFPVPQLRIKHVWDDDVVDEANKIVSVSGQDDSLGAKPVGWNFRNQGVTDGPHAVVVYEGVDQHHTTDCPAGT